MKNLIRGVLLVALFAITLEAGAQVKFGIKAGGNLCKMKFDIDKDYGDEPELKSKLGFHAGLITDIPLMDESLSLQPAFLFSNKGYSLDVKESIEDEFDNIDIDDFEGYMRYNYYYVEVPINLVYKIHGFQVSAGPYFAVGIFGTMKMDFSFEVAGQKFDNDDFFDEDKYYLKPVFGTVDDDAYEDYLDDEDIADLFRAFDCGLNIGVGYQLKNILFNIGYSWGLSNMTPKYDADEYDMDEDYTENVVQKNRVFSFSVAVFFN